MAILKYKKETKIERCPVEFQCDVCKAIFKLEKEYDIKYQSAVKNQMAVVKYLEPAGYDWRKTEIHCCSVDCLIKVIKGEINGISFRGADISIPIDGFYKRK